MDNKEKALNFAFRFIDSMGSPRTFSLGDILGMAKIIEDHLGESKRTVKKAPWGLKKDGTPKKKPGRKA